MNLLVAILMVAGGFFALVAALGVWRLPDFFTRMHAATKAGAFGASLMLLAAAVHFGTVRAIITSVLIIVFFYVTAPVASQTMGGAAYRRGVRLWSKTGVDQLKEREGIRRDSDNQGS